MRTLPIAAGLAFLSLPVAALAADQAAIPPDSVIPLMKKVADWQLGNPHSDPRTVPNSWICAPFFAGLLDLAKVSGDPKYRQAVFDAMAGEQWSLTGGRNEKRANFGNNADYHADDHAIAQVYIDYYLSEPAATRKDAWIAPSREMFDKILAAPAHVSLDIKTPHSQDRWSWCDALFMAPPAWMRMAQATGDPKYRDFANTEYWATTDYLFDRDEALFFRDSRFKLAKARVDGKKVFWSRGNGWVYAGLARIIPVLPSNFPDGSRYIDLFRKMSVSILKTQRPSGAWYPNLLDPAQNPHDEASGTAFFTFGLAWGLNHGVLTGSDYRDAALRGWVALTRMVLPDGKLGSVQSVGDSPSKAVDSQASEPYGVGGFLMAGTEIHRLLAKKTP